MIDIEIEVAVLNINLVEGRQARRSKVKGSTAEVDLTCRLGLLGLQLRAAELSLCYHNGVLFILD